MSKEHLDEETIFQAAIQIESPSDRAAYLDRACGDDTQLRAEVESLLKAHEEAGDFLETPAIEKAIPASPTDAACIHSRILPS